MKNKSYLIILVLASLAFSQSITSAQAAQMQAHGNVTAAEISAAREMLLKESKDSIAKKSLPVQEIQPVMEFESIDKTVKADDPVLKAKKFDRYEKIIFSQSLPSTFYEIQGMVSADYPLKPGDNLELSLWGAVERQLALSVNNQGNVFVEGVGLVNVTKLTLGEAEKLLTKKLQTVYSGITQGRISVNLRTTKLSPTKVYVMGLVQRPGGYDLPGNANVFLALYRAGGPSDIGSVRNIVIRRANGDSAKIDLYDFLLKGKKIGEGLLRDGDLVFVPRAEKLVKADGAIGVPAIYELKANESLSDLLSFAGGLLPNTDHTISLWRINEIGAPEIFTPGIARDFAGGKGTFQMQNGDSIFVFPSTRPNNNSVEVVGSVYYPGYYKWSSDMGIKEAVALAGGLSSEAFLNRAIVQRLKPDSSFAYLDDDFDNTLGLKLLPNDKVIVLDSRVLKNWRTVSVAGYVKKTLNFEWQEGINALDLIVLCGGFLPNASKEEIVIERIIPGEQAIKKIKVPLKNGLSIEYNKDLILEPGDRVVVNIEDSYYEHEIVALTGAFKNPGSYSLAHRGETFKEFIERVASLGPEAYIKGGRLFRKTLASDIQGTEVTNLNYRVTFDFEKVLQGKEKDIALQANDSIYIPFEMLTVNIRGEVTSPGHILWRSDWDTDDYLSAAGGLTINGDEDRIVLTYANGQKIKSGDAKRNPDPGSEIYVAYMPAPEPTKWTEIVTAIGSVATTLTALLVLFFTLK